MQAGHAAAAQGEHMMRLLQHQQQQLQQRAAAEQGMAKASALDVLEATLWSSLSSSSHAPCRACSVPQVPKSKGV